MNNKLRKVDRIGKTIFSLSLVLRCYIDQQQRTIFKIIVSNPPFSQLGGRLS